MKSTNILLNDTHKLIFLANPKTASVTCYHYLDKYLNSNQPKPKIQNNMGFIKIHNLFFGEQVLGIHNRHYNLIDSLDYLSMSDESISNYKVYVVLREPISRFKSNCLFLKQSGAFYSMFKSEIESVYGKNFNFRERLKEYFEFGDSVPLNTLATKVIDELQYMKDNPKDVQRFSSYALFLPQIYYFLDPRVICLDYKNIENELKKIVIGAGCKPASVPVANETLSKTSENFTENTIAKIEEIYKEDIDKYSQLFGNI